MKKIIYFILIFSLFKTAFSIDTVSTKYLPLHAGNIWVYDCYAVGYGYCNCDKKYKILASSPTIINGHTYYSFTVTSYTQYCYGMCTGIPLFSNFTRVDSNSGNILIYSSSGCSWLNHETIIDSLESRLNDSLYDNCNITLGYPYKCSDTSIISIFDMNLPRKGFTKTGFESFYGRVYAKGIGLIGTTTEYAPNQCYETVTLLGCVINGVVYGDTSTLVGINPISSEVPDKFMLYQNYPNPFNPTTKIKFDIPNINPPFTGHPLGQGGQRGLTSLKVYDILGREVATLVNDNLTSGTYEVEWDASNYASGVYFYKIEIRDAETSSALYFSETKKLILLK